MYFIVPRQKNNLKPNDFLDQNIKLGQGESIEILAIHKSIATATNEGQLL